MRQLTGKKNNIILYFFFLILLSTISNKALNKKENLFQIKNINISGMSLENNAQLNNKLYKSTKKNIFFLDKIAIKKSISEFNIIEQFSIKKIYPGELNIDIKPTKFIAKISNESSILVGSNGKLIKDKTYNEKLPNIFGQFNSDKFLELKKHVERSEFNFEDFKALFYYPSDRWDVLTDKNVLIKLPSKNLYKSLDLAKKILGDSNFSEKKVIDLRIDNQLIVK
tara:strand:+ start:33 stop:707 length:675 start_codon:yes stop_codon:yes gene_type:complete